MTEAETRRLVTLERLVRHVRHVDVEDRRLMQRRALNAQDHSVATRAAVAKCAPEPGCITSDSAIAGRPRKRPSMAAATVPEYSTSSPRFGPSLTPETTMSCSSSNRPEMARCTQSVGVPLSTKYLRSPNE